MSEEGEVLKPDALISKRRLPTGGVEEVIQTLNSEGKIVEEYNRQSDGQYNQSGEIDDLASNLKGEATGQNLDTKA